MYKVYGDNRSGNCHKVKLILHYLDTPYEWIPIDILRGETQTESFLEKNPNGKIPVLEFETGQYLFESNAILNFIAAGSRYLPDDELELARVLQWQFFEQYSHEHTSPSLDSSRPTSDFRTTEWPSTRQNELAGTGRWR